MNPQLQQFARTILKVGLAGLPASQQRRFRQLYSPQDPDLPTDQVVDAMPLETLDDAMQQVQQVQQARQSQRSRGLLPSDDGDCFDTPAPA